jgi:archaemetzincin
VTDESAAPVAPAPGGWTDRTEAVVEVVPLGRVDGVAGAVVTANLEIVLGLPARLTTPRPEPAPALVATGRQYDAGIILDALAADSGPGRLRLGLIASDLCLPGFTHVFGQAQMNGRAAVVSTHRLAGPTGDAPRSVLYTRLVKVALHEMAHVLGAVHCHRPECLMRFSSTLAQVDALEVAFCPECAEGLTQRRRSLVTGG